MITATLDQARKVLDLIADKGLDTDKVQWLLSSGLLSDLLESARYKALYPRIERKSVQKALGLVSDPAGLFTSPSVQLKLFEGWNNEHGLGFSQEDFAKVQTPPADDNIGDLVAWVLEAMLSDPVSTFDLLADKIVKTTTSGHTLEWHGQCIGLHKGVCWRPMTLRWVRIDFGANPNKTPNEVMGERSVHAGGLWMAAYSPQWLALLGKTIDGLAVPEPSMAGFSLKYSCPGVPHLASYKIGQQSIDKLYSPEPQSVPEYVE